MNLIDLDISDNRNSPYYLSIIIPLLNEENNIEPLYIELMKILNIIRRSYEIIFVDDGSTDSSVEKIKELNSVNKKVKYISLSRNYGTQIAISAGLRYAKGELSLTMDSDLQHNPILIPKMIDKINEGYDIIHAVKRGQPERGLIKRFLSNIVYNLINKSSEIEFEARASDFRLMNQKGRRAINLFSEKERLIRGMTYWAGLKHGSIDYKPTKRSYGTPKQTITKLFRMALEGVLSYSKSIIRIIFLIGMILSIIAIIIVFNFIYNFEFYLESLNYNYIVVIFTMILLVQLILLYVMGEYIMIILKEVKNRPLYFVIEKLGIDE